MNDENWKHCPDCGDTTDGNLDESWDYCPYCSTVLESCEHPEPENQIYEDYVKQTCDICGAKRTADIEWGEWEH